LLWQAIEALQQGERAMPDDAAREEHFERDKFNQMMD
jgi:hypothetical protein